MKVVKMLEFSQFLRRSYLETFSRLSWDEFVKVRHASFDSLRDIYLHCVEVLDRYVNFRIQGNPEMPRINFDDFDNMDKIKTYSERVESDVSRYLSTVTPEELARKAERRFRDGMTVQMTVEDMLIDIFQEEIHHTGEFIALLWQMEIEPPHLGWSRYINQ